MNVPFIYPLDQQKQDENDNNSNIKSNNNNNNDDDHYKKKKSYVLAVKFLLQIMEDGEQIQEILHEHLNNNKNHSHLKIHNDHSAQEIQLQALLDKNQNKYGSNLYRIGYLHECKKHNNDDDPQKGGG